LETKATAILPRGMKARSACRIRTNSAVTGRNRRRSQISIKIILPTAFVRHTEGQKQLSSDAANLPALIADLDQNFPALSTQIKDESGKLRRFINIYVNDEDIRFLGGDTYAFQDGDEVMLIPSIAGGR
jgi:molybdopterin synthase sulfur carrier subunit